MEITTRATRRTLAVLLSLMSFSAVACSSSNTSAAKAPVAYTAQDGRFTAEFPATPKREQKSVAAAGVDLVIVTYTTGAGSQALSVGYSDYPEMIDGPRALDGAADGSASNIGGTIQSKTDLTFLDHPAKDVVATAKGAELNERLFLVDNRMYFVIGVAPHGRPAGYDHLLETFALI